MFGNITLFYEWCFDMEFLVEDLGRMHFMGCILLGNLFLVFYFVGRNKVYGFKEIAG